MKQSPFIPGQTYRRKSDIHDLYGGNRQSGICPSAKFPYIFIFFGKSGKQHGYEDGWDNPNVFTYTGEGQSGDMEFTRGNLALRDHLNLGKRVFLFESTPQSGLVKFVSEVECFDVDYFETPDTSGSIRVGIKFFFKRIGIELPKIYSADVGVESTPGIYEVNKIPNVTERTGLVTSRVGQGAYRKRIIHRWQYQCAVTAFDRLDTLIASHIVPWAESNDEERLDVDNGLLLSPTYDALFDRHLISFENNGKIILSEQIENKAYMKIGVDGKERIKGLSEYNQAYLERHRDKLLRQ